MQVPKKQNVPLHMVRKYLEPGPVVLVSSQYKGEKNIMTMGWHTVMEFTPSLLGCIISAADYSFDLIRKSRECVINIPTADMIDKVTGIGNCSGRNVSKFRRFKLTAVKGKVVRAPLIKECYANFECRIYDGRLINEYNFFILEVVRAIAKNTPKFPKTVHYTGEGMFMLSGKHMSMKKYFKEENL